MAELTLEEARALAKRGFENPRFFCRFFLPEWFRHPMPPVHVGLLAILTRRCNFLLDFDDEYTQDDLAWITENFVWHEDPQDPASPVHPIFVRRDGEIEMHVGKYTLVMMPRGSGKTTLINAANLWAVLYQECRVMVYISEAATHAGMQLQNCVSQLESNRLINTVFGDLKPSRALNQTWSPSEGCVQTSTGITIFAKGRGSQIRGMNVNAHRPDRIIIDDVEDKESVLTEDQRRKTREWFYGDVMPALPELDQNASIIAAGTLLHSDALLVHMKADPEWNTIVFGALDGAGKPLWPRWMDAARIEARKRSYAAKGLLHLFYLEYFNTIRSSDSAPFRPEYLRVQPVEPKDLIYRAMAIDPAIGKAKGSSVCAIAVVGMTANGRLVFLDGWGKTGATPREQVDAYFDMHFKWLAELPPSMQRHGVESIAYQAALVHLLQEEMFRRAKQHGTKAYFEITPITHGATRKEERIQGILQPRYASGYIVHQRAFPELDVALLDFPNSKLDWPDAFAMAVSLLDDFAGAAAADAELEKDEYEPLGEWRTY